MGTVIFPAEWAEQRMVQLTWPHRDTDWAEMLDEVSICFREIARQVALRERLLIVTPDVEGVRRQIEGVVQMVNVTFAELPTNDTWARDHGGLTVLEDGRKVVLDFCFNGWGLKFAADKDNLITSRLHEMGLLEGELKNCRNFVFEGGSIESDGRGTLLTTAECLLSPNRNATMSRGEIEEYLCREFGAERVLWLVYGYLAGDDTDSHVDTLARLCPDDTIAYVAPPEDEADEHRDALCRMEEQLRGFRTREGKPYRLVALPMAETVFDENGERLPATYANYLVINGAVLVPTYGSARDELALRQIQTAYPDREIVGVDCRVLIRQHGSLHCVTMQYPK